MSSFELMENAIDDLREQMTTLLDQASRAASVHDTLQAAHNALRMESDSALRRLQDNFENIRTAPPLDHGGRGGGRWELELVDTKSMTPGMFSNGVQGQPYKVWNKKQKAWCNAKKPGFRVALDLVEREELPISREMISGWEWGEVGLDIDRRLHDMLLMVTTDEALVVVENYPGEGFEAWRQLALRFNPVGETYVFDRMTQLMTRTACKDMKELPGVIGKWELEVKQYQQRTGETFPEIMRMPILFSMVPKGWRKEIEAKYRISAEKDYTRFSQQLVDFANQVRYDARRVASPDDMEVDQATRSGRFADERTRLDYYKSEYERNMAAPEYSNEEWAEYVAYCEEQLDWLGKGGKGKGKKGKGKTGGGGGKGGSGCHWCEKSGHIKADCPEFKKWKADKDADRKKKGLPPFQPRKTQPARSLEKEGDYEEEAGALDAGGMTYDEEDCGMCSDDEGDEPISERYVEYDAANPKLARLFDDLPVFKDWIPVTAGKVNRFGKSLKTEHESCCQNGVCGGYKSVFSEYSDIIHEDLDMKCDEVDLMPADEEEEAPVTPPAMAAKESPVRWGALYPGLTESAGSTMSLSDTFARERELMEQRILEKRNSPKGANVPPTAIKLPKVPLSLKGSWESVASPTVKEESIGDSVKLIRTERPSGSTSGSAPRTDEGSQGRRTRSTSRQAMPDAETHRYSGKKEKKLVSTADAQTQTPTSLPDTIRNVHWTAMFDTIVEEGPSETEAIPIVGVVDRGSDGESETSSSDSELAVDADEDASAEEIAEFFDGTLVTAETVEFELEDGISHGDISMQVLPEPATILNSMSDFDDLGLDSFDIGDELYMDAGIKGCDAVFDKKTMKSVVKDPTAEHGGRVKKMVEVINGATQKLQDVPIFMAEKEEKPPKKSRVVKYRMKRGITMDSGAGDNVIPRRMVNKKRIRPSAGSKRGLHYVAASSHRIPNEGEVDLEFETPEGFEESMVFQVAAVNKPLAAVSDRVDNWCRVVFDKDMRTGQDLIYIFNKKTKRVVKLRRERNVWVLDATVSADAIETEGFSRQG